jgi:riboflavin transporter FmnP
MTDSLVLTFWTVAKDALSRTSAGSALLLSLCVGLVALLIDYAYMIYLYTRMVQCENV